MIGGATAERTTLPGHDSIASTASTENGAEVLFCARTDVNVEQLGDKFIVHDPVKNGFTQLGVAEYIVFACFDGKSTVQDVSDRLKREREVTASPANVMRFRDRLRAKQLLVDPGEVVTAEDPKVTGGNTGIGRLVMIDLGLAFNPDIWLTRLYHRIKYVVFRPAFFVALFSLVALALTVWLRSWEDIRQQASNVDAGGSWLLYYVCLSTSIFAHEVAHGVATKGFGGRVPKMGTFLYFFVFVFYTDVSASWMFPSKFRRLVVLFAGALANIGICALTTLIWRMTSQGSMVNEACFALMTINAVAASFTLFPLLRGDGYYIVSTALDIPNLRQNAFEYSRALLRRMFLDRGTKLPKASNRESLIYSWYAPLQVLFYVGFFGYVAIRTSTWLVGELHFLGFWIILLVLVDRLARPVLRIIPGSLKLISDALRLRLDDGPRPSLGVVSGALRAGGWMKRMWKLELLAAIVVTLLAVIPYRLHVSAPFEVISSSPVAMRVKTSGIVKDYTVASGQWVKAGEVIAELMDDDLVLKRSVLAAGLLEAQAKLSELEAGARREEIERARIDVKGTHQATAHEALDLTRVGNLYGQQMISRQDLDDAQAAHAEAIAREREARAELRLLLAGTRPEELERQRAVVVRMAQELAVIEQRLAWTKVRAVVDGRVVTPAHDLEARVGMRVAAGDPVIEVVAPGQLRARLAVPERFTQDVSLGMPVELRFLEEPDVAYVTQLESVEAAVTVSADDDAGTLGMLGRVVDMDARLPLGATGIAKIDAGTQSILGLLIRRCDRAAGVVFWSWW